jgi:predicted AlkP superfamily pyrophosphatase or phosphodiesterase
MVMDELPNLKELFSRSAGGRIQTVNPSLTYPAHTSMITGVDPGIHRVEGNTPIDPFNIELGAWKWFTEDIQVKTIVDFAREEGLSTGSVYWPVSVGKFSDWNIPQIWRTKTYKDQKLLKALSTPGLYEEMMEKVGIPVSEITSDNAKIRTGIEIFLSKNPDLLLIYSTDVDSYHHWKGPYSQEALERLKMTDDYIGELIEKTNLYNREDLGLIILSDHGFHTATRICAPNRHIWELSYIDPKNKEWSYYFKSSGGTAFLFANSQNENKNKKQLSLQILKNRIEKSCPGTKLIWEGEIFQEVKKNSHPDALAILLGNKSIYISNSWEEEYITKNVKIHTHGYPKEMSEMDTIGFFYPGKSRTDSVQRWRSIKDSFSIACNWLGLQCSSSDKK